MVEPSQRWSCERYHSNCSDDITVTGGTIKLTGQSGFGFDGTTTYGGDIYINGEKQAEIDNSMPGGGGAQAVADTPGGGPGGGELHNQQIKAEDFASWPFSVPFYDRIENQSQLIERNMMKK